MLQRLYRYVAWLGTWGLSLAAPGTAKPALPNVIVVLADQWRPQAFGFAGDPNVQTPHIDRLASESIRFINAVAGLPVCLPTRASLLTGQRPLSHGVFLNDVPLDPAATTLPKVLQAAGWDTAAIGKWHLHGQGRSSFIPRERRQGFAYWKVLECTHDYTNSTYFADGPEPLRWTGYDAHAQTRDAIEFMRSRSPNAKPFFLWLAWGPPHDPYQTAPARYRERYDPQKLVLRPNVPAAFEPAVRTHLAGYYAHCSALDDAMGELLATLESSGLAHNTLLVFTADHGDMLGSQGLWKKQKPYDESTSVPLLLRWPAGLGRTARTLSAPFNSEDLMPTLLGLLGLPLPPGMDGLNFSAHLRGGPDPSDGAALLTCISPFGEFERRIGGKEYRGLRTPRYTFVRDLNGPWLLFDNQEDPYQQLNLVNQPAQAGLQARLEAQLQGRLAANHDAFLPGPAYVQQRGYRTDINGTVPYRP